MGSTLYIKNDNVSCNNSHDSTRMASAFNGYLRIYAKSKRTHRAIIKVTCTLDAIINPSTGKMEDHRSISRPTVAGIIVPATISIVMSVSALFSKFIPLDV